MDGLLMAILILSEQRRLQNVFIIYRMKIAPIQALINRNAISLIFILKIKNWIRSYFAVPLLVRCGPFAKKARRKCNCLVSDGWKKEDLRQSMRCLSEVERS